MVSRLSREETEEVSEGDAPGAEGEKEGGGEEEEEEVVGVQNRHQGSAGTAMTTKFPRKMMTNQKDAGPRTQQRRQQRQQQRQRQRLQKKLRSAKD